MDEAQSGRKVGVQESIILKGIADILNISHPIISYH